MEQSDGAEKKRLPQRLTRGKRLRAQLDDEEEADAEFWNQDFFAEDARDEDYVSEKEEEDVPDSDFYESESEEGDEEVEVRKEPKKKALKAPGAQPIRPKAKSAAPKPPRPPSSPSAEVAEAAEAAAAAAELSQALLFDATYEAPTLRRSTQKRVEEAKREREQRDQMAKLTARPKKQGDSYVMTQEELLAEAARTELENLASLKVLVAQEEETKRKANMKKQRFGGPLVKLRSRAVEVLAPQVTPSCSQQQPVAFPGMVAALNAATATAAWGAGGTAAVQLNSAGAPADSSAAPAGVSSEAAVKEAAATIQPPYNAGGAAIADAEPAAATSPNTAANVDAALEYAAKVTETAAQPAAVEGESQLPKAHEQQQQQQPTGPILIKQEVTTLQCCGMKAPLWLQPHRAGPPPGKPLCAITGVLAKYRDPSTGYPYASAAAFRELRRRLGQPVPDPKPKLAALVDAQAMTTAAAPLVAGQVSDTAAAADGYPCGQEQLQHLLAQQLQHQQAAAAANKAVKSRGNKKLCYQQSTVPDEVAALVVGISPHY